MKFRIDNSKWQQENDEEKRVPNAEGINSSKYSTDILNKICSELEKFLEQKYQCLKNQLANESKRKPSESEPCSGESDIGSPVGPGIIGNNTTGNLPGYAGQSSLYVGQQPVDILSLNETIQDIINSNEELQRLLDKCDPQSSTIIPKPTIEETTSTIVNEEDDTDEELTTEESETSLEEIIENNPEEDIQTIVDIQNQTSNNSTTTETSNPYETFTIDIWDMDMGIELDGTIVSMYGEIDYLDVEIGAYNYANELGIGTTTWPIKFTINKYDTTTDISNSIKSNISNNNVWTNDLITVISVQFITDESKYGKPYIRVILGNAQYGDLPSDPLGSGAYLIMGRPYNGFSPTVVTIR